MVEDTHVCWNVRKIQEANAGKLGGWSHIRMSFRSQVQKICIFKEETLTMGDFSSSQVGGVKIQWELLQGSTRSQSV